MSDRAPSGTPVEIVTEFLDAVENGDFRRAGQMLSSEGFSYRGPIDQFDTAKAFLDDLARISTILKRIERRRFFSDGNEVCAIVTYVTTVEDVANTRAAHWLRIENGLIVSIEGFLDARAYARMFEPEL